MCEYCNENKSYKKRLYDCDDEIFINDKNKLNVYVDCEEYQYNIEIKINYCPMCGRKLKGENKL